MYALMPRKYRMWLEKTMVFAGSSTKPPAFFNNVFGVSIAVAVVAAIILRPIALPVFAAVFAGIFALFHSLLFLAIQGRANFVEKILPDALQLMAANCRAGYIPNRALLLSARPEFGPLSDAIKMAGKQMATGMPLDESLRLIPQKIKSEILSRTMRLIIEGSNAGGQFASLLDETADDIRRIQSIRGEVAANIVMYSIFIGFAACIGAPVLYALSSHLVGTIGEMGQKITMPEDIGSNMPKMMGFSTMSISPDFLFMFSLAAIGLTTFFGGLIIGLIGSGQLKSGIRYAPLMAGAGIALFLVAKTMIASMFTFFGA